MVKKLLKHEFIYYLRTFGIVIPIVLVIAGMTRLLICFDNNHPIINIILGSSVFLVFLCCIALMMMTSVIGIVRFYKNMYSAEGYLTFTLPVTQSQHIFVKLLAAMVCQFVGFLTVCAVGCIVLSGDALSLFFQGLGALISDFAQFAGAGNVAGYIIEFVLLMLITPAEGMLLFYACITVGQMAKKNRVLMAFVAFFVYYLGTQVVGTIFTIIFYILGMSTDVLNNILIWMVENAALAFHLYLCGTLLLCAGLGAVFWLVTQRIMKKKLNLE